MNAQKGLMVVLGLGALAGVGYAVASSAKDTPPAPNPSPPGPLPPYVPQALIDSYERCYTTPCTDIEYNQILAGLQELSTVHPEDSELWMFFANELQKQYSVFESSSPNVTASYPDRYSSQSPGLGLDFGAQNVASQSSTGPLDLGALGGASGVPLPLPLNFPATLAVSYVNCWYQLCPQTEFDTLIAGFIAYMNRTDITDAQRSQASVAMKSAFNRRQFVWQGTQGTRGVTGRHTGGCSCQARQEEVGTGACCDSCAKGEECSECGEHAPAVG